MGTIFNQFLINKNILLPTHVIYDYFISFYWQIESNIHKLEIRFFEMEKIDQWKFEGRFSIAKQSKWESNHHERCRIVGDKTRNNQ